MLKSSMSSNDKTKNVLKGFPRLKFIAIASLAMVFGVAAMAIHEIKIEHLSRKRTEVFSPLALALGTLGSVIALCCLLWAINRKDAKISWSNLINILAFLISLMVTVSNLVALCLM